MTKFRVVWYGLVAGAAVAFIIATGPFFLAEVGIWVFNRVGWKDAAMFAARFGFLSLYTVWAGLLLGTIICVRLWIKGFRDAASLSGAR